MFPKQVVVGHQGIFCKQRPHASFTTNNHFGTIFKNFFSDKLYWPILQHLYILFLSLRSTCMSTSELVDRGDITSLREGLSLRPGSPCDNFQVRIKDCLKSGKKIIFSIYCPVSKWDHFQYLTVSNQTVQSSHGLKSNFFPPTGLLRRLPEVPPGRR